MDSDSNISSVQPKIKNFYNDQNFDYAGGCGGELDIFCFPFSRGRIFNTIEKDNNQYDKSDYIFWASGTGFMTRKSIFNKVNGFDKTLFAHMEEIDYHWKCHLLGYNVSNVPSSIIYHKGGQTLDYQSPFKTYLNHRNSFLLLLTNYSIPVMLLLFIPRLILEFISIFYELLLGRINHSFAIIKSLMWLVVHPNIIYKRIKNNYKLRKINDFKMMKFFYKGSIVLSYFILNKKTFKSL